MNDVDYEALMLEALTNAKEDRSLAKEAYEHMKPIFEIKADSPETLQAVMLTGNSAVKLIESMSRSNEQIIKMAQLAQKAKPKDDDKEEDGPFDIDAVREEYKQKVK